MSVLAALVGVLSAPTAPDVRGTAISTFAGTAATAHALATSGLGWAAGDIVISVYGDAHGTAFLNQITPSGDDPVAGTGGGSSDGLNVSVRSITGSIDTTYTYNLGGGVASQIIAGLIAVRDAGGGIVAGTPVFDTQPSNQPTAPATPSVPANSLVIAIAFCAGAHTGATLPAGYSPVGQGVWVQTAGSACTMAIGRTWRGATAGIVPAAAFSGFGAGTWAAAQIAFAPPVVTPLILGTPAGIWRLANSAATFNYTVLAGADGLVIFCFDDVSQTFGTPTTWTASGQSAQTMTPLTARTNGATQIRAYYLANPVPGVGVIAVQMSGITSPNGILPLSISGWKGITPVENGQAGALVDPPPFNLTSVAPNSLIIHGVCASSSGNAITFAAGETSILEGNAGAAGTLRWATSKLTSVAGGTVSLESNIVATNPRYAESAIALAPGTPVAAAWNWPTAPALGASAVREVATAGLAGSTWDYIKIPGQAVSDGTTLRMFYEGSLKQDDSTPAGNYHWWRGLGMMTSTNPDSATSWAHPHTSPAATFIPGGAGATHEEGYFQLAVVRHPGTGVYYCVFGGQDWISGAEGSASGVNIGVYWQSSTSASSGLAWTPNDYAGSIAPPSHQIIPPNSSAWAHTGAATGEYWPAGLWYDSVNDRWHMTYEAGDGDFDHIYYVSTTTGQTLGDLAGRASSSSVLWTINPSSVGLTSAQASSLRSSIADRGNGFVDILVTLIDSTFANFRVARIPVVNPRAATWALGTPELLYHFGSDAPSLGIGNRTVASIHYAQMLPPCVHASRLIIPYHMAGSGNYEVQIRYFSVLLP